MAIYCQHVNSLKMVTEYSTTAAQKRLVSCIADIKEVSRMSSSDVLARHATKPDTSGNKARIREKAYVLLFIVEGKSEQAVRVLWDMPGVAIVDCLEGNPNLLVILEAPDRLALAELMMPVLAAVDSITEDLRLLVTRDSSVDAAISTPK